MIATVANPNAIRRPGYMPVSHDRGVTTYKPAPESTTKVTRSKSDVVGHMYDRRQIGEVLLAAAREFQKTYELAGYHLRSNGDLHEYVDGGNGPRLPISDARRRAVLKLADWKTLLGAEGYVMVTAVLIDQRTIRELAEASVPPHTKALVTFMGHLFRRQLGLLAEAMGLA